MAAIERDQKDLVLGPSSHAFVLDKSKGQISVWNGPVRVAISNTDETVSWNVKERRFNTIQAVENAIQVNVVAREGEYIILDNPTLDGTHPPSGTSSSSSNLEMGKTTVIHGPASFALWPMQSAVVVQGHILRSDQYLVVKVVDEAAARRNFDKAVIKGGDEAKDVIKVDELSTGRLFIIPGNVVNFYMPCSGFEVLKIEDAYMQNAVTVEAMEYAYLRDQSGEKRYAYGPDVVFPKPTETFVTRTLDDGAITKTFRVIELTETSGLYVKVIEDYKEEDGTARLAGDELFITGKDHPIFRPRREQMLIKQGGGSEIHYSIAIPDAGTGYYVINKRTWKEGDKEHKDGVVELIRGPRTLLIDPRNQTLTKRALPLPLVELMYPGNAEALEVNTARLDENARMMQRGIAPAIGAAAYGATDALGGTEVYKGSPVLAVRRSPAARSFEGDVAQRPDTYKKPRAISLESSKYDGAPRMMIQPGYAVLLVNSTGARRVVKDGDVVLLEYDEVPVALSLSTGTPKTGTLRKKVVYLRMVTKISDKVQLETSDGVRLTLEVSYRVRFVEDSKIWFNVEDPVGLLTDNMRSRIHGSVHQFGIKEFYSDFANKVRSIVLGEGKGHTFEECNLHVYDVDVLRLSFEDRSLEQLFLEAAKASFRNELRIAEERRGLELDRELSSMKLAKAALSAEGSVRLAEFSKTKADADANAEIAKIIAKALQDAEGDKAKLLSLKAEGEHDAADIANEKLRDDHNQAVRAANNTENIRMLEAETAAAEKKMSAIQPGLIDALSRAADIEVITRMAPHLSVQGMLGGGSIADVFGKIFGGTRFAKLLGNNTEKFDNGHGYEQRPHRD